MRRAAIVVAMAMMGAAGPCAAAEPAERAAPDAGALSLFEQSARAYREGRFQAAVELLLEARKRRREPVMLYDLGRAYEALGRPAEAADAYASYLDEEPLAADRKAIEGRIGTLRAQAAELAAARARPAPTPAPAAAERAPVTPEPGPPVLPWVVTGIGVATVGVGLGVGSLARSRHDAAAREPVQSDAARKQDEAESFARAATVTIVAGAALAVAGVALWILHAVKSPSPVGLAPRNAWLGGVF